MNTDHCLLEREGHVLLVTLNQDAARVDDTRRHAWEIDRNTGSPRDEGVTSTDTP